MTLTIVVVIIIGITIIAIHSNILIIDSNNNDSNNITVIGSLSRERKHCQRVFKLVDHTFSGKMINDPTLRSLA